VNDKSLRIVIVGGVAGGASAATRARRMNEDAQIIMLEKDRHVSFANCGLPYYLGGEITDREKLLVAKPELFEKRFNIDVRTRHEVTGIDRSRKVVAVLNHRDGEPYELGYDKLILAPGASPIVPPIGGVDAANVFTLRNVEDVDRVKSYLDVTRPRRAVVVGAGFIGLEMIEQLHGLGIETRLVELVEQVLPPLDAEMAHLLQQELEAHHIDLHLGDGIKDIRTVDGLADSVVLNSGTVLGTDLVIMGVGVRPNVKLAVDAGLALGKTGGILTNEFCQTEDKDIYAVGDAAEYEYGPTGEMMRVPLAGPANRAGRTAGEHAATGKAQALTPVYGTAIARVFGLAAGMTGLSRKLAERLGREAKSVTILANQHVGYYPGAMQMVLKLIYEPGTGKVLGAQAVGAEGIDKRIDVIATAMRFGATVRDLTGLDLTYAPPFGAAKDPVHMAAFTACNELDGLIKTLDCGADLTGLQALDVRSDREVAKMPFPNAAKAVHIPIDELRGRMDELDPARPTVVTCASGLRSYVACRLLMQHGFADVWNLTGGVFMRTHALAGRSPSYEGARR
jgi:NADPH-dependent 2,4-dienoyl-CoA reductase/sulfur reductase-like enzyme/rhodanese-related sulfurtransferase